MAELLQKDRKATAEFVARYADCVHGYVCWRLMPRTDLVEDLVQDVFVAAWEGLKNFRGDSSLQSWLLGIARHKVEDHYRKQLKESSLEEADAEVEELSSPLVVDEVLANRQVEQRTREIISAMPGNYGIALLWRYWERRSVREMAVLSGKTEKAIERLLARARSHFKKRWNERHASPGR